MGRNRKNENKWIDTGQGGQAGTSLREFRVKPVALGDLKPGAVVAASLFAAGQKVDVAGTSIGKGFTGTIKRYNFNSGRASHGNSRSHNVPGSIGMAQDPGRVFPGKRMSGHMGDVAKTIQNLEIARVDAERSLLMVRGAVPGAKGGAVVVTPAIKTPLAKGGVPRPPKVRQAPSGPTNPAKAGKK